MILSSPSLTNGFFIVFFLVGRARGGIMIPFEALWSCFLAPYPRVFFPSFRAFVSFYF